MWDVTSLVELADHRIGTRSHCFGCTAGSSSRCVAVLQSTRGAITAGLSLATLAKVIHPYPTQAEDWKHLGKAWNRQRLTPRVRGLFERSLPWSR